MPKTYGTVTTFTAGSVLTAAQLNVAGGAVNNLVVPAACRLKLTGNKAHTSGNTIQWDSIAAPGFDTDSMWSSGANTRITFQTAGIYVVTACVFDTVSVATSTYQLLSLNVNGLTYTSTTSNASVTGIGTTLTASMIYNATAGDYAEVAYTFAGGTHSITANNQTQFSATWIGRTS